MFVVASDNFAQIASQSNFVGADAFA